MRTSERRVPSFMIFMTPIVRVVKKENLKNVDNHIRFFSYEKFKESDYISNHKM